MINSKNLSAQTTAPDQIRKQYQPPVLEAFGKVSTLTQSGSANAANDGTALCGTGSGTMGRMC